MSPDEPAEAPQEERHLDLREILRRVHPVYDPVWLRRSHPRCLWDGAGRTRGSEFCSVECEERYANWEQHTSHGILGREPLPTFFEEEQEQ